MHRLVDSVFEETLKYLKEMPKAKRKTIGQFFTSAETARYMASMFISPQKSNLSILDPGAGSGILTAAVVDRLQINSFIKHITLICYETSEDVLPILKRNLEYIKTKSAISVDYKIINDNYITSQSAEFIGHTSNIEARKYDWIICNPPYKKIAKEAVEATSMPNVCHGASNLYFLFAAMGLFNLAELGEMVFIIPRSWTSGAYFGKFREYLFSNGTLKQLHLFVSRDKVFEKENVLQETIIIKVDKAHTRGIVKITCSNSNSDFNNISTIEVPYNNIIMGKEQYVYLVTNSKELNILQIVSKWKHTLLSVGLRMRTGLTVDFRNLDYLRSKPEAGTVPLLCAQHIKNGQVTFPLHRECEYITTEKTGLIQQNKNYLLVKRFTSKEETRRFQCGIYLSDRLSEYAQISTHNKINFIEGVGFDLTKAHVYGLYVIFNSTIYDQYFRILSGSTQVNSTEVNTMPIPPLDEIEKLGIALIDIDDLSVKTCDRLLGGLINGDH